MYMHLHCKKFPYSTMFPQYKYSRNYKILQQTDARVPVQNTQNELLRATIWLRRDPFASIQILSGRQYFPKLLLRKMRNSSHATRVVYTLKSHCMPLFLLPSESRANPTCKLTWGASASAHPLIIFLIRNFSRLLPLSPPAIYPLEKWVFLFFRHCATVHDRDARVLFILFFFFYATHHSSSFISCVIVFVYLSSMKYV